MASLNASPGDHIRNVRKRLGLTLSELSASTGLAVSTLSKLEKGNVSLSYDKLTLLSKGMGVDMAELLHTTPQAQQPTGGSGRRAIMRAGEGQVVETEGYRHIYLASELLNKRFTPLIAEIRARTIEEFTAEFGGFIRHPGEEFAYVLEGEVDFCTELYAPTRLKAGDSIYFDSEMGHAYLKANEGPCRLVASCAPRHGQGMPVATSIAEAARRLTEPAPAARPTVAKAAPRKTTVAPVRGKR